MRRCQLLILWGGWLSQLHTRDNGQLFYWLGSIGPDLVGIINKAKFLLVSWFKFGHSILGYSCTLPLKHSSKSTTRIGSHLSRDELIMMPSSLAYAKSLVYAACTYLYESASPSSFGLVCSSDWRLESFTKAEFSLGK
jgi:hypothetical protein